MSLSLLQGCIDEALHVLQRKTSYRNWFAASGRPEFTEGCGHKNVHVHVGLKHVETARVGRSEGHRMDLTHNASAQRLSITI